MTTRLVLLGGSSLAKSFLSTLIVSLALLLQSLSSSAHAQVLPIIPSGLNTQVSGPIAVGGKTQFDIIGGTRPNGGLNLFHSFGEFGVPTNNIANFLNEAALPKSNIIVCVREGSFSTIVRITNTLRCPCARYTSSDWNLAQMRADHVRLSRIEVDTPCIWVDTGQWDNTVTPRTG